MTYLSVKTKNKSGKRLANVKNFLRTIKKSTKFQTYCTKSSEIKNMEKTNEKDGKVERIVRLKEL